MINLTAAGILRKLSLMKFCMATGGDLASRWRLVRAFCKLAGNHSGFRTDHCVEIRGRIGKGRPLRMTLRDQASDVIIFREIFFDREYQACTTLGFDPTSIYDIGANVGLAAAYFRARWPDSMIVGFEPAKSEFTVAERNYARLGAARLFQMAVGSEDGEVAFETHPQRSGGQHVVSGSGRPAAAAADDDDDDDGWEQVQVRMRRLDAMIERCELPRPDLIKIDVEGHEVEVLEGLGQYLGVARGVLLETHSPELHENCRNRLLAAGFDVEEALERNDEARVLVARKPQQHHRLAV